MEILIDSLTEEWQNLVRLTPRLAVALATVLVFWYLGRSVSRLLTRIAARDGFRTLHLSLFRKLVVFVFAVLGVILALHILDLKVLAASLAAGGGITAVILGFAFREIGENILAGVFLAFSRPFQIGDLIQSGDLQGVVRSIELHTTHIRSAHGRDIFIPSSRILGSPLINFTVDGLRCLSFKVGVDYGDDTAAARLLLSEAVDSVPGVERHPPTQVHLSNLADQWVEIEVSFWVDFKRPDIRPVAVRTEVLERCRRALMAEGFTVSSNVSSNVALSGLKPVEVRMAGEAGA